MSDVDDRAAKDTAGQLLDKLLAEKYGSDPSNTYARLRGENDDMQAFRRVIDETRIRRTAAPDPPPVRVEQTLLPIQTVTVSSPDAGGSGSGEPGIAPPTVNCLVIGPGAVLGYADVGMANFTPL